MSYNLIDTFSSCISKVEIEVAGLRHKMCV